jgi:hypothetical protein
LLAGIEAERLIIGETLPNTRHDLEEAAAIARLLCRSPASINAYPRCEAGTPNRAAVAPSVRRFAWHGDGHTKVLIDKLDGELEAALQPLSPTERANESHIRD